MSGLTIARVRRIPIRLHVTFLLVLPLFAWEFAREFPLAARAAGLPPGAVAGSPWAWGIGLAVALFASVLVHELAHALYAVAHGGRVRDITLLMIGGVSRISEPPAGAWNEAVMAAAGPATSIALAALFWIVDRALLAAGAHSLAFGAFFLAQMNLLLGAFNLLPAFPMDGGRVLRAALLPRTGAKRATRIAANVGKTFAVLLGLAGLVGFNIILIAIAGFLFAGADAEAKQAASEALFEDLRVRDLMLPAGGEVPAIHVRDPADLAAELMRRARVLALPVLEDGRAIGVVTARRLARAPEESLRARTAGEVAIPTTPLAPGDPLMRAIRIFGENDVVLLPVSEEGRYVGTISRMDVARAIELRALDARRANARMPRRGDLPA